MTFDMDFLPAVYRRKRQKRNRMVCEAVIIACTVLAMGTWTALRATGTSRTTQDVVALEKQAEELRLAQTKVSVLTERRSQLARQLTVERQLSLPVSVTQIVAVAAEQMSPAIGLTQIQVTMDRPQPRMPIDEKQTRRTSSRDKNKDTLASRLPAPARIELIGLAPGDAEVADFVERLSDHPLFGSVQMDFSRRIETTRFFANEFRLELHVPLNRAFHPSRANSEGAGIAGKQQSAATTAEVTHGH